MEESSDCTLIVKEGSADFHGTVLDATIDSTAVRLVKIDSLEPKISETRSCAVTVEDIVVLDDDRVVLLIKFFDNRSKMLQLFSREFVYLCEVDINGTTGGVFQSDQDKLALFQFEDFSSKIEFCSVKGGILKHLWNGPEFKFASQIKLSNQSAFNGDVCAIICKVITPINRTNHMHYGDQGYENKMVVLIRKTGEKMVVVDVNVNLHFSPNVQLLNCVSDVGYIALDDNNSRFYHLSLPRRIQCFSFFGSLLWTINDMGTGLGLDNSLLLGMTKVGNKLCCYLGDSVLIFHIDTKKITTVKLENESDFETVLKYATSNRERYDQAQYKSIRFLPGIPKASTGVQYKGNRVLITDRTCVDVYSLRPY